MLGARGLRRTGSGPLLVRLELADGGHPRHTSSATLTLRVCRCQGPPRACAPAAPAAPGLSTAALLAILAATTALLGECPLGWGSAWGQRAVQEGGASTVGGVTARRGWGLSAGQGRVRAGAVV